MPPDELTNKLPARKRLPGEEGIWIIVLTDLMVFTLFFGMVLYYRALSPEIFSDSRAVLTRALGIANTLLLLTSSLFVALAIQKIRESRFRMASHLLACAIGCGVGFGAIKVTEWADKVAGGHTISSNDFFMMYFVLTGIHFLHLLIGLIVLSAIFAAVLGRARSGSLNTSDRWLSTIEGGGVFWHLVDLLWIVLFALFYLVP